MSDLPPGCNRFCRDCVTNKTFCDNQKDFYGSWNCDLRPSETSLRLLKESENLVCKQFVIYFDQESAQNKFGKQNFCPF